MKIVSFNPCQPFASKCLSKWGYAVYLIFRLTRVGDVSASLKDSFCEPVPGSAENVPLQSVVLFQL